MIPLFGLAIFLSAGLVFLVQPMTAKLLLPAFGGSPQVWTASMVFFQAALLAGYAYADLSIRRIGLRRQPLVHAVVILLPLLVLPIGLRGLDTASGLPPALAVVAILLLSVGAPYVAVSATSPLLQRWFASTGHSAASDPYFLYAASNVGSLIGLLGYPLVIEPRLPLGGQGMLWSVGYVAFVGLCLLCAVVVRRNMTAAEESVESDAVADTRPIDARRRLGWLVRAFVPSSLMLGVTSYSSTDIAAVPLLWAIPLSLYLLTFVLAFSRRKIVSTRTWERILPFTTALVLLTIIGAVAPPIWARLSIHYVGFFVAAMVAHSQLADDRPSSSHLTGFYLLMSVGGVLGGIFNALVAPWLFDAILEYPLVIVLALLLRPGRSMPAPRTDAFRRERRARLLDLLIPFGVFLGVLALLVALSGRVGQVGAQLVMAMAIVLALVFAGRPVRFALATAALLSITYFTGERAVFADRSFFGLNRVVDDGAHRIILSGSTIHGVERLDADGGHHPMTYYHPTGPAGQVFAALEGSADAEVAIVGLGAGSLSAYGQPGQHYTFIEIDPVVIRIARDPSLFRFVSEAAARVDIQEADGRLWLETAPDGTFDLIVVDAFSSDAIPAHLLTREALQLYFEKLRPDGRLLINASNSYLDVRSVVAGGAMDVGLVGYARHDPDLSVAPPGDKEVSEWVVVARSAAALADIAADPRWMPVRPDHPPDRLDRRLLGHPQRHQVSPVRGKVRRGTLSCDAGRNHMRPVLRLDLTATRPSSDRTAAAFPVTDGPHARLEVFRPCASVILACSSSCPRHCWAPPSPSRLA